MAEGKARVQALRRVIDEVRLLFHHMKVAAEQIHQEGEGSAARRGVLLTIHEKGPRTVPQIAAERPVSRQHIQSIVNGLLEDGLLERRDNPAHKRSHLMALTNSGQARVRAKEDRERQALAGLELGLSESELLKTAGVLEEIRQGFRMMTE